MEVGEIEITKRAVAFIRLARGPVHCPELFAILMTSANATGFFQSSKL